MSGIPDIEPVAVFPTREVLNKAKEGGGAYNNAMRQWLLDHFDSFRAALGATSVKLLGDQQPRIEILREAATGAAFEITINLTGYQPRFHKGNDGMISLNIGYRVGFGGGFIHPDGHATGDHNNLEFEQVEILPEGLGLRLRRKVSDPRTLTYIDALGNLTTETTSPLVG